MKVNIKDHELDLHYSLRIYMIYENIEGTSLESLNANSITSTISLIYATLVSTLKYNKIEEKLTLEDVIEFLDNNGGMKFVNEFSLWFTSEVNKDLALAPKPEEPKSDTKEPNKKKSRK